MVQRPSNPRSATQGEVAKRGSISGRLLQIVPEKGNGSDIQKKKAKLKGTYARSTFSRNYLFLCQQLSHVYGSDQFTEWSKKHVALPTAFRSNADRNKASPQMVKGELL